MQQTSIRTTAISEPITPEQIVSDWQELGVSTLEELAARASAFMTAGEARPQHATISLDDVLRETPSELARNVTHRAVQQTVFVDGSEVNDLATYDGQPLHFVVSSDTLSGGPLIAYSRVLELKAHMQHTLQARDEGLIGSTSPRIFTPDCFFFEHDDDQGDVRSVRAGFWYRDLTRVTRSFFWQDWNDVISSVAQSRSLRIAWEHIHGQGNSITLNPGVGGNLRSVGWNDRISSIANYG